MRVKSNADLVQVIASQPEGLNFVIVELPTRADNAARLKEIYQRVASAVRIGINLA